MIIVLGSVTLQPGQLQPALALSREHVARSRREPGCLEHGVSVSHDVASDTADAETESRLVFVERWASLEALKAHFAVPASRQFVEALTALASAPPSMQIFDAQEVAPRVPPSS